MITKTLQQAKFDDNGVKIRAVECKNSYFIKQTVEVNGILYEKDKQVEINDKYLIKFFIRNNII